MTIKSMVEVAIKDTGSLIEPNILRAFIATESGGIGFDSKTGKLLIQFEPVWFKRREPYAPSAIWWLSKVVAAYAGQCINVTNETLATSSDIGFDQFGNLDTLALAKFLRGSRGFYINRKRNRATSD